VTRRAPGTRPTSALRREIRRRVFPWATSRGFVASERDLPRLLAFRRTSGTVVHMLEIQWDKYARPRFVVHFGTCPAEGLTIRGEHFTPERIYATWLPDSGSLQPRRGTSTRSWFRQDTGIVARMMGGPRLRDAVEVVDELLALLPEVEAYWAHGVAGPHLRLFRSS
jgi:hypothetical protein